MIKFLGPPIKRVGPKQKSIVLKVGMRLALRKVRRDLVDSNLALLTYIYDQF